MIETKLSWLKQLTTRAGAEFMFRAMAIWASDSKIDSVAALLHERRAAWLAHSGCIRGVITHHMQVSAIALLSQSHTFVRAKVRALLYRNEVPTLKEL